MTSGSKFKVGDYVIRPPWAIIYVISKVIEEAPFDYAGCSTYYALSNPETGTEVSSAWETQLESSFIMESPLMRALE